MERMRAMQFVKVLECVSMNLCVSVFPLLTQVTYGSRERRKEGRKEGRKEETYCIFSAIKHTTAVYVILPRAKMELSSVKSV
jgi:hypothetical protein